MTNRAWYLTLEAAKREAKIEDVLDDATIKRAIEAVTKVMPRQFFVQTVAHPLTAVESDHLLLGDLDLLSLTELATDDGSRTYPTVWAATDYDIDPYKAPYLSPPHPYWKIRCTPNGRYRFPVGLSRGVRATGRWGFYDIRQDSGVVVAMPAAAPPGLSISATTLLVSAPNVIETGHTLRIGSEDIFVSAVNNASLTVERGVNGSTPAVHADGASIEIYTYPAVDEATIIMMQMLVRRTRDAPMGVIGSMDGFMKLALNDRDVVFLLGKLVQPAVAGV